MKIIGSTDQEPFSSICDHLAKAENDIVIVVPYIRANTLLSLVPNNIQNVTIVTTWKLNDLWMGVSDINLFNVSKEHGFKVFINNRIHLKLFMNDWSSCILGSANLTERGLGLAKNYNYELMVVSDVPPPIQLYIRSILTSSVILTEEIFDRMKEELQLLGKPQIVKEIDIRDIASESDYLISALPMSKDVEALYSLYKSNFKSEDKEAIDCCLHDIALYRIPLGLSKEKFYDYLSKAFFGSPFIRSLLKFIDVKERYFGEVKEWVQTHCTNVPVPSRRDLSGNVQVLYKWIAELSEGTYLIDRPNYSERIRRMSK